MQILCLVLPFGWASLQLDAPAFCFCVPMAFRASYLNGLREQRKIPGLENFPLAFSELTDYFVARTIWGGLFSVWDGVIT